jgi:RNA polymerase sigma factor (sigma-70 family)
MLQQIEQSGILEDSAREAAAYAVNRCARGLLPVEMVAVHVRDEWLAQAWGREEPSVEMLRRMALRYCSRRLYLSCCSLDAEERDCAFHNLRHYLQDSLSRSIYAHSLTPDAAEDVLQQTLAHLHRLFTRQPPAGPDDPAAFLKWTHTILLHTAHTFVEQARHDISLEAQSEAYLEQNALDEPSDQIEEIYTRELQRLLRRAILSLKNPRYRLVLAGLFLAGMEESELASALGVQAQDIYLWRHRALKALRSNREIVESLHPWLHDGAV